MMRAGNKNDLQENMKIGEKKLEKRNMRINTKQNKNTTRWKSKQ